MKSLSLRFLVLALLSLLCMALPAFAAGKAKGKAPKKTKAAVEVPFDAAVDKLPAKFMGNNPFTIFTALAKNESKYGKSEFETNDAFQARLLRLDETILTGKLKYSSPVAFSLLSGFDSSYDADSGAMTVSIPMTSIHDEDLDSAVSYELPPGVGAYSYSSETLEGHAIEVFTTLSQTKKFTGSNAFGVKVKITGKVYDTLAVALKNDNGLMKYGGKVTLNIPIPSEKAREAKLAGDVLIVGELLHPYVGKGFNHNSATIDNPVETLDRIRYVAIKATEIWYFSRYSGEIYHKQKISYVTAAKNEDAQ